MRFGLMRISRPYTMDFTTTDVYSQVKRETADGFEVVVLPSGSTLYRTDRPGQESPPPSLELFLGDRQMVTEFYGNEGSEGRTLSSYTTTTPTKLMVFTLANLTALATGGEFSFINEWYLAPREHLPPSVFERMQGPLADLGKQAETPIVIPAKSLPKTSGYTNYTNRELARIVCKRGFDGWIVFPNSVVEYDPPTYRPRLAAVYSPEVLLCKGAEVATREFKGSLTGGRRRTTTRRWKMSRKMSRAYCKRTPCRRMGFTQRASCRPYKNCFTRTRGRSRY